MKFANLLTKFYFEVWGIRPEKHISMGRLLNEYLQGRVPNAERKQLPLAHEQRDIVGPQWEDGEPLVQQMKVKDGIALISVHGVLGKHLSFLELWCGGCDYDHIGQMVDQAAGDTAVHTVVLDINSPGGMVVGLPELCVKIAVLRAKKKKAIAYADVECCSCGYWLAAACDEIYAAPSAVVGCIGCYVAGIDTSREWEMEGWKLELFRSGSLKAIGLDGKEWTDAERAYLQGRVDRGGSTFRDYVLSRRNKVANETMEGQWFDGAEGVALGLVDNTMGDLAEVLAPLLPQGR